MGRPFACSAKPSPPSADHFTVYRIYRDDLVISSERSTYTPSMRQPGVDGRRRPSREGVTSMAVPTLFGWALGLSVTAVILGPPYLLFAYHSPELHLVLDCLDTGVAFLVAFLLFGRYRRSGGLQDLLLTHGLFLLAFAGVGLTLSMHLLGLDDGRAEVWLPVALPAVGAALG